MGSNNYEPVQLHTSSYETDVAVVLVKTSQGDTENCDTLIAHIVHSMVTVKLRYGFVEVSVSGLHSLSSAEYLYNIWEVAGKVSRKVTRNGYKL